VATYAEKTNTTMGNLERFTYQQDRNPDRSLIQFASSQVQQNRVISDAKYNKFNIEIQGPPTPDYKIVYEVSYNSPTTIPTMTGSVTIQLEETKTFDTKEEAQSFLDNRQEKIPYTQDSKILPLEKMYSGYDIFAKEAYQRAEEHTGMENSWIYEGGAAWTSFGGDILNLATMGGDLLDKHIFNREVIEKKPITTIPTYYDKGTEKALEGIEITETGITGVPSFNPLDKNNIASKWYQGASEQWGKQTTAQNIGQTTVAVPLAIIDVVSAGQIGTSIIRKIGPSIAKVATKIASTPTIVTKVIEVSSNVKINPIKSSYAKYNINSIANPDKIDLNFKGVDYMDSPKPPGINLQSKAFTEDLANKGIEPVNLVKIDPDYSPTPRIDLNLKNSPDYMESPKPPVLNLQSEAFQKDLVKQSPKGIGNYGAEQFRKFQESVLPSINIIGRIKLSEGFVPGKPTRPYTPYKPNPVEADPYYSPEKIDLNLKGSDYMESPKPPILDLQSKSFLKDIKKNTPNYERAASDFVDFQKSLDLKPQKYSNIVGIIKFSEGFIPNKNPTKVIKKPDTNVKEDILFKPDKPNKKTVFDDDDKLAGWTTKPIEGGQATGSTTIQILKPQTKKPLKTSKKLLQEKQNPTPTARDFTKMESERTVSSTSSSPLRVIPIPRDPRKKDRTKKKIITTTETITSIETMQVLKTTPIEKTISNVKIKQRIKQIPNVVTTQRIVTIQPQKTISKIKPLQAQRTPTTPRPKTKLKVKPVFKIKTRQAQAQPNIFPTRIRVIAGFLPPPDERRTRTNKRNKRKRKGFLGNTRTDHIVGLFKREEVIYGDKKTAKQLKKDKKWKEGKKKRRNVKNRPKSFSQRIGIINKGFKI
jgi:hypothetical protein